MTSSLSWQCANNLAEKELMESICSMKKNANNATGLRDQRRQLTPAVALGQEEKYLGAYVPWAKGEQWLTPLINLKLSVYKWVLLIYMYFKHILFMVDRVPYFNICCSNPRCICNLLTTKGCLPLLINMTTNCNNTVNFPIVLHHFFLWL